MAFVRTVIDPGDGLGSLIVLVFSATGGTVTDTREMDVTWWAVAHEVATAELGAATAGLLAARRGRRWGRAAQARARADQLSRFVANIRQWREDAGRILPDEGEET